MNSCGGPGVSLSLAVGGWGEGGPGHWRVLTLTLPRRVKGSDIGIVHRDSFVRVGGVGTAADFGCGLSEIWGHLLGGGL